MALMTARAEMVARAAAQAQGLRRLKCQRSAGKRSKEKTHLILTAPEKFQLETVLSGFSYQLCRW
jgi:hypothetical protein